MKLNVKRPRSIFRGRGGKEKKKKKKRKKAMHREQRENLQGII